MIYLISQFIGLIAFIISLFAFHRKSRKKIFSTMILSNLLNTVHYLLLNAYSGCITKVIAVVRDSFIIAKDSNKFLRRKIFLIIFILVYIICAYFTYNNILSIFPIFAATIYLIFIWDGNELKIKKIAFLTCFLWLVYNIYVLSIPGIISNVISIISDYIAIKNFQKSNKLI